MDTLEQLNSIGIGKLPGHLGIVFTQASESELRAEIAIKETHMAPNGYPPYLAKNDAAHHPSPEASMKVELIQGTLDAAYRRRVVSPPRAVRP